MRNFLINECDLNMYLDRVFVEPTEDECYCIMLGARRKYLTPEEQTTVALGGADMLRRVIIHSKDQVKSVVREMQGGTYLDRSGIDIPDHAMTVYITENPRSHRKAAKKLIHELTDRIFDNQHFALDTLAKTALHKSPSRKIYLDYDFDFRDVEERGDMVDRCVDYLKESEYYVILTKNGFHLLLKLANIDPTIQRTFYKDMKELEQHFNGEVEVKNDAMCPLPGCSQGGDYPRIIPNWCIQSK